MQERFLEFLSDPKRESYLVVRDLVLQSEMYEPYSDEFKTASELYDQEKWEEARQALQQSMPNLLLSPRAHHLLGFLFAKSENHQAAEMEMYIAHACLIGIESTGDGSPESPYLVLRTTDEYDLLEHLDKERKTQFLLNLGDRHLDLLQCKDGSEIHFDITAPYTQMSKSFER